MQSDEETAASSGAEARFARSFRQRREELGLSQTDVARELADRGLRLDASAVTRIERGQRSIKLDEATVLADVIKVPLTHLLEHDPGWREAISATKRLDEQASQLEAASEEASSAMSAYLSRTPEGSLFQAVVHVVGAMGPAMQARQKVQRSSEVIDSMLELANHRRSELEKERVEEEARGVDQEEG